ncbi:hypothetical protein GW17_00000725, partial [Ensete ventricosum]
GQVQVEVEVEVEVEGAALVSASAAAAALLVAGEVVLLRRCTILSRGHVLLFRGSERAIDVDRSVSLGVEAAAEELPLDVRVPVVLDLVVGPSGQSPCYQRPSETHTHKHAREVISSKCRDGSSKEDDDILVSEQAMELDDELVFFGGKIAALEIGTQVVYPPEPAALATSKQTLESTRIPREKKIAFGERSPAAFAMGFDVGDQLLVFLLRPSSLVCMSLLTAWRPAHTTGREDG